MKRMANFRRKTKEADLKIKFCLDGKGKTNINTGLRFFDHMLELFCFHGLFDIEIKASADLKHHLTEDLGISLGEAFRLAVGSAKGIKRFGYAIVPMDEARAEVIIDIGGRPYLWFEVKDMDKVEDVTVSQIKDFFSSFCQHARINLHIEYKTHISEDPHHIFEAIFKAWGIALDKATQIEKRRPQKIPSTKGLID